MELCYSNEHSVCVNCCAARLPFFSVGKLEFKALASFDSTSDIIRYDEYFSMSKLSNLSLNLSKQDFFILHFNVRSLPKNINKLDEFLNDFQRMPDAIAISETKLNSNNVSKIKIPYYNFLRSDSSTNAGGVGLYIKDTIKFSLRNDLKLNLQDCEDLWLEESAISQI